MSPTHRAQRAPSGATETPIKILHVGHGIVAHLTTESAKVLAADLVALTNEPVSQSITSDRISESTIARIAGNLLSGMVRGLPSERHRKAITWAVATAREIAAEVQRTGGAR